MQQRLILFSFLSLFIFSVAAQQCEVWTKRMNCITWGCVWNCPKGCHAPKPGRLCHYGDFVDQPLHLKDGHLYSAFEIYQRATMPGYVGYDMYTFNVPDPMATVTLKVDQEAPGTSVIYMSPKTPQPNPDDFTWVFDSPIFTLTGNSTNPLPPVLYIGVTNNYSQGYYIKATATTPNENDYLN